MSKFLGPIHTWLFNKIVVFESIEKDLETHYDDEKFKRYHNELKKRIGDYIPNQPLENLIDSDNIHGWLQSQITKVETRQAAFINKILTEDSNSKEIIKNIYNNAGQKAAKELGNQIDDPSEIFNELDKVLIEGMPCDRVNRVEEETSESFTWITQNCVHKNNWESNGVDVTNYYNFRAALIKGFVEKVSSKFTYIYTNESEQVNKIIKRVD